jgi:hypothetical protein
MVGLLLLPALAPAQSKKKDKKSVPAVFANARYVYVQAEDGDVFNPRLLPEDREAISNVYGALRDWGRYILTPSPDGAELVFLVRKGRVASATIGGTVGPANPPPNGSPRQNPVGGRGIMTGGEVGPPDDLLEVRMTEPDGGLSSPIWEHSMTEGLDAPDVPLLKMLRDAVERDYPQK